MDGYSRAVGVDGQFRLGQTARFNLMAFQTMNRDLDGHETSGTSWGTFFQRNGRTWRLASFMGSDDPDAATDLGFIRRTNSIRSFTNASYRWWPEGWVINWGPRIRYQRLYDHESILEDETIDTGVDFTFARSISAGAGVQRQLERFAGINYLKTLLATYRLNAGTVFCLGYDDRYRQQELFEEMGDELLLRRDLQRTNRAIFTKLQYLFRL